MVDNPFRHYATYPVISCQSIPMQTAGLSDILQEMSASNDKRLVARLRAGDMKAAARLISLIEDGTAGTDTLKYLYPHTGRAHVLGVTGPPGAGKSTLTDALIGHFRAKDMDVGVIAIDPTSALTGGAVLGDRVRMQRHSADSQVFIRSLAARGWGGGLARAAIGVVHVLEALGKAIIMVETVGAGQVEMDIVRVADTTVLVLTPGSGDEIQQMKAGILEAADIVVVNKADKDGAEGLKADLETALAMKETATGGWTPPVLLTEAINDKGTAALAGAILEHYQYLTDSGELARRRRRRVKTELLETITGACRDAVSRLDEGDLFEEMVDDLLAGRTDPGTAARKAVARLAADLNKEQE
jgi:LAO/AO transport system kinase